MAVVRVIILALIVMVQGVLGMSAEVQEVRGNIPNDISKSQIDKAIDEWIIGKNAERNRAILRRRLFDGITFELLADEFSLSVRQTKNIVYKGERKIFSHII